MMTKFTPHDVIYLQYDEPLETSWCQDKINETDVTYLLATPRREAADAMYEALKNLLLVMEEMNDEEISWSVIDDRYEKAKAALELAENDQ